MDAIAATTKHLQTLLRRYTTRVDTVLCRTPDAVMDIDKVYALREELTQLIAISENMHKLAVLANTLAYESCYDADTIISNVADHAEEGKDIEDTIPLVLTVRKGCDWADEQEHDEMLGAVVRIIRDFDSCSSTATSHGTEVVSQVYDGVGINCRFPAVRRVQDIPEAIHYLVGGQYREGLYIRLAPDCVVRIPLPDVSGAAIVNHSIPCRNKECSENPHKQRCHAHIGDAIVKVGTTQRCARKTFGKHETFEKDIEEIEYEEIRQLMMNSLSDALLCSVWGKRRGKGMLPICDLEKVK